jgi:hypothetical protein
METYSRNEILGPGSDRSFGLVFTAFCGLVALLQLWTGSPAFWGWLAAAALFAGFALAYSRALRPLNVLWFKFGMLLHHVMSPVVLAIMFYAVFTPVGWCMRLAGRRPLSLRYDPQADSYWILRNPPAPPPGSFDRQF